MTAALWISILSVIITGYIAYKINEFKISTDIRLQVLNSDTATLLAEFSAKNDLRLACIDRRLQVHQEAFTLWYDLLVVNNSDQVAEAIKKCRDWYNKNCIYLEPSIRGSFLNTVQLAALHIAYVESDASSTEVHSALMDFLKFPDELLRAINLPPLSEIEIYSFKSMKDQTKHNPS